MFKNYAYLGGILLLLTSSSIGTFSLDPIHSFIVAPHMAETLNISEPVIIGIITDAYQRPVKNKPVTVFIDLVPMAITSTNKHGVWSCVAKGAQALQNGAHVVQACVTFAPHTMAWTQANLFYVKALSTAPLHRSGNVNGLYSVINFPYEGAYINGTTPVIVGSLVNANQRAVSGETVNVKVNGVTLGNATSDNNGVFSYQVINVLSDGDYTVGAHCVQSNVDLSENDFTVDTAPPAAPVITFPTQNGTATSSTVIVTGTTEAEAMITTFMDGDTFGVICYADENGNWSNEYDGLANGAHSVTAQATDFAQNNGPVSAATSFTVSA